MVKSGDTRTGIKYELWLTYLYIYDHGYIYHGHSIHSNLHKNIDYFVNITEGKL